MDNTKLEHQVFNNDGLKNRDKYSEGNVKQFFANMPTILEFWREYLESYVGETGSLFGIPEFPWEKFDEPTWVSSLAIAIARNNRKAILIEELPIKKGANTTEKGNADLWCSLESEDKPTFSFYLEAKFSPWARERVKARKLPRYSLHEIGNEMVAAGRGGLISKIFRDYQKSSGNNNISTKSPHSNEKERKHDHVFLSLIVRPIWWKAESWKKKDFKFTDVFGENSPGKCQVDIHSDKENSVSTVPRNLYNIPAVGMVMREKDENTGFIALVMMLGESDGNGRKPSRD